MRIIGGVLCLLLSTATLPAQSTLPGNASPEGLAPSQSKLLAQWFAHIGRPRAGEPFGTYLARAAYFQRGLRYHAPAQIDQQAGRTESLRLNLKNFDCISLIESSFAVARCGWRGRSGADCFISEVVASRYRGGRRGDYADRLHYFSEWLSDNSRRGRLRDLAPALGGRPARRSINYMSRHPRAYPALKRPEIARRIRGIEARLSRNPPTFVDRQTVARAQKKLRDGDIVAIVTNVRGLLVTHAGLVLRVKGQPRLLHASRYHKGVVLDGASLAGYVSRRPERKGLLIARPRPPGS